MKRLKELILETTNATFAISIDKDGNFILYFQHLKRKFTNSDFDSLCEDVCNHIIETRIGLENSKTEKKFKLV